MDGSLTKDSESLLQAGDILKMTFFCFPEMTKVKYRLLCKEEKYRSSVKTSDSKYVSACCSIELLA